jgi:hypothetical protein
MAFFPLAFLALLVLAVGQTAWLALKVARAFRGRRRPSPT